MSREVLDSIFSIVNIFPMPFWLMIAIAPGWIWSRRLVYSGLIPGSLGLLYAPLFALAQTPEGLDGTTLAGILGLFAVPQIMVVGWIHYLAFDLMVGGWIARDAWRRGIHRLWVAPVLFATLMAGPAGLLAYLILRALLKGPGTLVEEEAPAAQA